MSWAGGLSFAEIVALALLSGLLLTVVVVMLGPDRAERLISVVRGRIGNGHEQTLPQRRSGKPFVIGETRALTDGGVEVKVELGVVKSQVAELREAVLGKDGLMARMHTLETKVDAQPTRVEFDLFQKNISTQLFTAIRDLKSWLRPEK